MLRNRRQSDCRQYGFTLIELLVVVSIVSLLVSILMPALGAARDLAKAVTCASNMRQVGLAFDCYGLDHDDWIIQARDLRAADNGEMQAWNFVLIPYVGQACNEDAFERQAEVFFCPVDKDPYPIGYGSYWHGAAFTSYALNGANMPGSSRRPGCKLGPAGGFKATAISRPVACMLMAETSYSYQIYDADHRAAAGLNRAGHHRQTSGFYHDSAMNILFVDGHVERVKGKNVEPVKPIWDVQDNAFWDDLSLPNAEEDPAFWGPGY